jgi:hypothetical protein
MARDGWPLNDSHAKPNFISRNVSIVYHLAALPPTNRYCRYSKAAALAAQVLLLPQ